MPSSDASSSVEIAAAPQTVYALVTDLAVLSELADETARMRLVRGSGITPGAVFKGANRNGWHRWTTTCRVTDADGSRFAFDVSYAGLPVARWQYEIESTVDGCRVTETTWDRRPGWFARLGGLATGVADRGSANARHIERTLQRLKSRAEAD